MPCPYGVIVMCVSESYIKASLSLDEDEIITANIAGFHSSEGCQGLAV